MVHRNEMAQLLLESGALWASRLNVPWFLAGAGFGVPAAVGTVSTGDSKILSLVSGVRRLTRVGLIGFNKQSAAKNYLLVGRFRRDEPRDRL